MKDVANRIVERIWDDVTDRRGIKHEFEACEPDIKKEIRTEWRKIIREELEREAKP